MGERGVKVNTGRHHPPRLNTGILPIVDLNSRDFWDHILPGSSLPVLTITHFTDARLSKILATLMRDAANGGPALRNAHGQPDVKRIFDLDLPKPAGGVSTQSCK